KGPPFLFPGSQLVLAAIGGGSAISQIQSTTMVVAVRSNSWEAQYPHLVDKFNVLVTTTVITNSKLAEEMTRLGGPMSIDQASGLKKRLGLSDTQSRSSKDP